MSQISLIFFTTDYNYLVVPNLQAFLDQFPDSAIYNQLYGGINVNISEEEQLKVAEEYEKYLQKFNAQLNTEGSYVYGSNLADASAQMSALFGGVFFIGIFLSIILWSEPFWSSTTNKFLKATKTVNALLSCRKSVWIKSKSSKPSTNEVLTVFFLPLLFAFIHLAFAYQYA